MKKNHKKCLKIIAAPHLRNKIRLRDKAFFLSSQSVLAILLISILLILFLLYHMYSWLFDNFPPNILVRELPKYISLTSTLFGIAGGIFVFYSFWLKREDKEKDKENIVFQASTTLNSNTPKIQISVNTLHNKIYDIHIFITLFMKKKTRLKRVNVYVGSFSSLCGSYEAEIHVDQVIQQRITKGNLNLLNKIDFIGTNAIYRTESGNILMIQGSGKKTHLKRKEISELICADTSEFFNLNRNVKVESGLMTLHITSAY